MSGNYEIALMVFIVLLVWENQHPFRKTEGSGWPLRLKNLFFASLNSLVTMLFVSVFQKMSQWVALYQLGILNHFSLSPLARSVLVLLFFDAWLYFWHRINHEIPFLWRFHRMHHTDPLMNATTALRFHPGEIIISNGLNVLILMILGLSLPEIVFYNAFLYPVIFFHHSNIILPESIDRVLRKVIVTPHMHKVHHSQVVNETNSNYGGIFSIWDRMCGSLCLRDSLEDIVYGIGIFKGKTSQSIPGMLITPLKKT